MKKNTWIFFLLILMACSKDNQTDPDTYNIETHVFYQLDSPIEQNYPDVGAKVFVYYDKLVYDFMNYSYEGEGIFIKKDSIYNGDPMIKPDQTAVVDGLGNSIITPQYTDKEFLVVVESNIYSPQLQSTDFPSAKGPIKHTLIFKPQKK